MQQPGESVLTAKTAAETAEENRDMGKEGKI